MTEYTPQWMKMPYLVLLNESGDSCLARLARSVVWFVMFETLMFL